MILRPILFNIYTNDQLLNDGTRNFVYADELCVTAPYPSFTEVEHTIEKALDELTIYYRSNRKAKRKLEVKWNNTDLENTPHTKLLGVTLDRTLSYKQHIHKDEGGHPKQPPDEVIKHQVVL